MKNHTSQPYAKNYLTPKTKTEVLLAAGECKTWAEIMIRYKVITGYDTGE